MNPVLRICAFIPETRELMISLKEIGDRERPRRTSKKPIASVEISDPNRFRMEPPKLIIAKGDRILIDGPSGAGKSLLVKGILEGDQQIVRHFVWKNSTGAAPSAELPFLGVTYLSDEAVFEAGTILHNLGCSLNCASEIAYE